MANRALKRACEACGGQSALARAIGVKQAHIWNWLNVAKDIPAEYVLKIEAATKGSVTCNDLRPDIYPLAAPESHPARASVG